MWFVIIKKNWRVYPWDNMIQRRVILQYQFMYYENNALKLICSITPIVLCKHWAPASNHTDACLRSLSKPIDDIRDMLHKSELTEDSIWIMHLHISKQISGVLTRHIWDPS